MKRTNSYLYVVKITFGNLKKGIQKFHRKFVLEHADKAANNVVVLNIVDNFI